MTNRHTSKFAAVFTAVLLVCAGSLLLGKKVSAAGTGSVAGSVKLSGPAPHMKGIDMSKDPYCAKQHDNAPVKMENVVVGSGDGLQNVVLYITQGLPAADQNAVPSEQPKFDQKGCMYSPHVLAVDANQKFEVTTDDQTTHNIHPLPAPGSGNIGWNKSQPPGAPPIVTDWKAPEAISVKCNIHPWMHGYFVVLKTNHFSVTGDDGTFSIKDLPPGKYTLTAWQETLGSSQQEVTIGGAGETKTVNFTFKGKAY